MQGVKFLQCLFFISVQTKNHSGSMQMQCFRAGFLANQGDSSGTILCQDAQAQFLAPGTEVDVEEGRETPRWGHTQLPVNQT